MQQTWDIATAHGWHDKPISTEHYCGLIMTEMAEAIEADRNNNRRADSVGFAELLRLQAESTEGLSDYWYDMWYCVYYKEYIKGSIEEEFADVVIRILDMAKEIHGDKMVWRGYYPWGEVYNENKSFIENAWFFIREVLNWGTMNISDSVSFMFNWAHHLDIDLWKQIEWKMKYNELRPYKHGGKKY
jgi:NTP pyrophosphatase (non-canonical NTP hydrolase)